MNNNNKQGAHAMHIIENTKLELELKHVSLVHIGFFFSFFSSVVTKLFKCKYDFGSSAGVGVGAVTFISIPRLLFDDYYRYS